MNTPQPSSGTFSTEPMDSDELNFLKSKYKKVSVQYMRVMNILLVIVGTVPLVAATAIFLYTRKQDYFFRAFVSFFSIMVILFIVIAASYYLHEVFNLYRDTVTQTKTIEKCVIAEKKYMAINHTFHFIINSEIRYSLEISENEFHQFEIGDEINIEYSTYCKEYFGFY